SRPCTALLPLRPPTPDPRLPRPTHGVCTRASPMTVIVLFGGRSDERHVSAASAQNVLRALGAPLAWFWGPGGAVHDVNRDELLTHEEPFTNDFEPSRPAIWPDLEMALDTLPVED